MFNYLTKLVLVITKVRQSTNNFLYQYVIIFSRNFWGSLLKFLGWKANYQRYMFYS